MPKLSNLMLSAVVCLLCIFAANAQIATGGAYTLDQTVVANGGGRSSDAGNTYRVEGTGGQPVAGTNSMGGAYSARGGFWAGALFAPTAAGATVSGRIVSLNGDGLRGVTVTLEGGTLFTPLRTRSNAFGYFTFEDVAVGQVYTITVSHKKYGFAQETQIISVLDNVIDIIFQANWEN